MPGGRMLPPYGFGVVSIIMGDVLDGYEKRAFGGNAQNGEVPGGDISPPYGFGVRILITRWR